MNSFLSKLLRQLSTFSSAELLSTSRNSGEILLFANRNQMSFQACAFHMKLQCVKHQFGVKKNYQKVDLPSSGSLPLIRSFHQSLVRRSEYERFENKKGKTLTWEFRLHNPYGLLSIETDKSVEINRINVLQHPGGDFAAFHLVRRDTRAMPDKAELLVNYDEERNRLSLVDNNVRERSCDERWVLEVPPYYDLTVQHTGDEADVIRVENLENQTITIQSVGDIHVHNLKSRDIVLDTTEGEVKSTKVLQGNAVIKTRKDKGFTADRLQGQKFDIQTEDGNVRCKDIYGNTSSVSSQTGNLNLGNVTGECSLSTAGNVAIGSIDGSLEVNVSHSGSVQAYLVRPASVSITTDKGDVSVSLPLHVKCRLNLTATNINVPAEMSLQVEEVDNLKEMKGAFNEGQSPVSVCSNEGSISVSVQSWFDSLKLGS